MILYWIVYRFIWSIFMSLVFKESFSVTLPDSLVEEYSKADLFTESKKQAGLIVEIAAIHEGYTENNTYYSAEALKEASHTWVTPYPKPVIMNHDVKTEPIGRVIGAKMAQEDNGKQYLRIQAAITDPTAIEKVLDKRYMTGSIGGKAGVALCSVCNTDWAAAAESGTKIPCRHRRGKIYDGVIATLNYADLVFKEYSFVNVPADSDSYIRDIKQDSSEVVNDDSWVKASKFFLFDLSNHKVSEYTEDESKKFVLNEMESKFLYDIIELDSSSNESLFVISDNTDNTNENVQSLLLQELNMQADKAEVENEDILTITDQLSEDLSTEIAEGDSEESKTEEEKEENSSEEEVEAEAKTDTGEQDEKAEEGKEATAEEEKAEAETAEAPSAADKEEEKEVEVEDQNGLDAKASVEPEINLLNEKIDSLEKENLALKKALHKTLAERVVDAKIAKGIEELPNRVAAIEEHSSRSASSLADSLRDLAKIPALSKEAAVVENLVSEVTSTAVAEAGEPTFDVDNEDKKINTEEEVKEDPKVVFVEKLSDVLLGKTQLH